MELTSSRSLPGRVSCVFRFDKKLLRLQGKGFWNKRARSLDPGLYVGQLHDLVEGLVEFGGGFLGHRFRDSEGTPDRVVKVSERRMVVQDCELRQC